MTAKVIIREYNPGDLAALVILTNELGYPGTEAEMKQRLDRIMHTPDYKTIVATIDHQVIGYMGMCRQFFWEQNGHYIKIQALVVKTEFRGSGAGKKLIEYAEDFAKRTGATSIFLNCGNKPEREGAHKFYPKMGFEAKSTGYVKKISL